MDCHKYERAILMNISSEGFVKTFVIVLIYFSWSIKKPEIVTFAQEKAETVPQSYLFSLSCLKWLRMKVCIFCKAAECTPSRVISCQHFPNSEEQLFGIAPFDGCFCERVFLVDHPYTSLGFPVKWNCGKNVKNDYSK